MFMLELNHIWEKKTTQILSSLLSKSGNVISVHKLRPILQFGNADFLRMDRRTGSENNLLRILTGV